MSGMHVCFAFKAGLCFAAHSIQHNKNSDPSPFRFVQHCLLAAVSPGGGMEPASHRRDVTSREIKTLSSKGAPICDPASSS